MFSDQQDMLLEIVRKRQIERRRDEIAQNVREAIAAYRARELKAYTAEEAIAKLQSELDLPE